MKLKYIGAVTIACIVLFLILQSIQEVRAKSKSSGGGKKSSGGSKNKGVISKTKTKSSGGGKNKGVISKTKTKSLKKKALAAAVAFYTPKKVAKANKKVDILRSMHMQYKYDSNINGKGRIFNETLNYVIVGKEI